LARVTEAETSERGFLITSDPDYLRTHRTAIDSTWDTFQRMRKLVATDPAQARRIDALEGRIRARFDELHQAIAAQQAEGFDGAKRAVSTNHGRQLMNEMRQLV